MDAVRTDTVTATDPVDALDHALHRLMWLEQKRLTQALAEHALTVPQFLVMINLVRGERSCTIGELANRLFQSHATMTGIIDRLETERLVARTRGGESDRRKVMVQLTPKGRHLLERAKEARREKLHLALALFPAQDIEPFLRLLNNYLSTLEKEV